MSDDTIYNFTATFPVHGYCETKQGLGPVGSVKEPGNVIFCLVSSFPGILGVVTAKQNMSSSVIYLYALIIGYGVMKGIAHATLWNGFDKIAETMLKLLQSLIIAGYATALRYVWPFSRLPHSLLVMILITVGMYPCVAVVLGSSYNNPWVSWLTFDGIWFLVLIEAVLIWCHRKCFKYQDPYIFYSIWYAVASIVIAYVFWLIDEFACSFLVACLYCQGWWNIFLAFGFYYCIVLHVYMSCAGYNQKPIVNVWPNNKFILIFTVSWKEIQPDDAENKKK